jgi:hypothetical protein
LRSNLKSNLTNELKAQYLYTFQDSYQNNQLGKPVPRAIVENVMSPSGFYQYPDRRSSFAQESFRNNVFQIVDNLYYNTDKVKYTFGADLMYTTSKSIYGSEVNGRFLFQGMNNFDAMTPYRFYREVPLMDDPSVRSNIWNLGIYGQFQTKIAKGLDLMAGIRLDYGGYPKAEFNQKLYDEMGIRTDNKIKSFVIQPRFQFDWNINEGNKDFLKFGAGIFSSDINNYMIINNLVFDGKHLATVDVTGKMFRSRISTVIETTTIRFLHFLNIRFLPSTIQGRMQKFRSFIRQISLILISLTKDSEPGLQDIWRWVETTTITMTEIWWLILSLL